MTSLIEDTGVLMALPIPDAADDSLDTLSHTVITWISLQAKAQVYDRRVTRSIASAANLGATLEQMADAAGMSAEDVLGRLRAHPGSLSPQSRLRLGIGRDAHAEAPATRRRPWLFSRRQPRRAA